MARASANLLLTSVGRNEPVGGANPVTGKSPIVLMDDEECRLNRPAEIESTLQLSTQRRVRTRGTAPGDHGSER